MRKILLFAAFVAIPFFGNSQIFQENFDGAGPGFAAWTLIDVDGQVHASAVTDFDAGAWVRKNRGGPIPNYGGPDNDFAAMSSSWYNPVGISNDWLISPQIVLPAANAFLQWEAKAQDPANADGYKVMLAPNGGNTVADFTVQLFTVPAENTTWITRTVNLSAYAGTNIRVAFVNNSNDKFVLLVDNISVNLVPTAPPNCPALVAPTNGAAGINYYVPVPLSWSASAGASSYDVYLGTSSNPTTLLGNVVGTNTTATAIAGTTYYWKVLARNAFGASVGCTEYSFTTNQAPTSPPNCPVLVAPANGATSVNYVTPVPLSWSASTGATSYDVFLGTTSNPTTSLGTVIGTSTTAPGLLPSTTYYWKVLGKNEAGVSVGCTQFSFTTAANPFAPYCGPLVFATGREPITLVNFAGINNVTSPVTAGATGHENFTSIVGNVSQGGTYPIILKGNTDGNFTNRFAVFIDWNQNGILDDNGETYLITQTIINSTGTDAIQATQNLAVPTGATLGNTRMRVKKIFGTTNFNNPCLGAGYGQAEDYTINVAALATSENAQNKVKIYPNPVVDYLSIESAEKVKSISVFDATGKLISTQIMKVGKSKADLSKLNAGVYIVKIEFANETQTVKVIKK